MIERALLATLLLCVAPIAAFAQDPTKVAPQAYKLELENDWVKVVRVHYEPREKIAAHDHPTRATVFVYLRDGGPVRFNHVGAESYAIDRPPIAARAYRVARPVSESHEVENLSDLASDFLRVELKTEPVDAEATRGRFKPPTTQNANSEKVELDTGWMRIVRMTCAAGGTYEAKAASTPSLLVAFAPIELRVAKKARTLALGETLWVEPGANHTLVNAGAAPVEVLRIELNSKPARAGDGEPVEHKH
jgi:quercetin dioxygenase-like cupin family protein